jgi:hypothetical protein
MPVGVLDAEDEGYPEVTPRLPHLEVFRQWEISHRHLLNMLLRTGYPSYPFLEEGERWIPAAG